MTIPLKPEEEYVIGQSIQAGLIANAEEALDIAVDTLRTRLTPAPQDGHAKRPLAARIRDMWQDMPGETLAKLPSDGASQIDHYVYGMPKRSE